jgi:hypothetical protein
MMAYLLVSRFVAMTAVRIRAPADLSGAQHAGTKEEALRRMVALTAGFIVRHPVMAVRRFVPRTKVILDI